MGYHPVHEHVSRANVEGHDLVRGGGGRQHRQVGDAADVQQQAAALGVAAQQVIGQGHEGSALAASGHVRRAEIGNGGDPGALSDNRRFPNLQGSRRARPGQVTNRLTVGSR